LQEAIFSEDVETLKKIKGIGAKSAQRIIVDLKDKLGSLEVNFDNFSGSSNTVRSEALKALQNLGFDRRKAQKIIDEVLKSADESIGIEDLIKRSLKSL
jgi:Holliday junction DNA helicase RuvA